jgi:hypothetical protein
MSRVKTEDRGAVRIDVGIPGRAGGTVQAFQAGDHFHPAIGQSNIQEHRVCAAGDARFWVRDNFPRARRTRADRAERRIEVCGFLEIGFMRHGGKRRRTEQI